MISPLLTRPQGCQGCQKIWETKLKTALVSWRAKIWSKLNKFWKTFRKQGFFDNFCSILTVFHSFFNFGWILALQFTRADFSLVVQIFWHPWHPWGHVNSGDIIVLRFVFDIFVPKCHLAIFFILFKLKPDITCIDLTSTKSDNITFRATLQWLNLHSGTSYECSNMKQIRAG